MNISIPVTDIIRLTQASKIEMAKEVLSVLRYLRNTHQQEWSDLMDADTEGKLRRLFETLQKWEATEDLQ